MIIDNLILEKCVGKGSFGEVYITSIKGDDKRKLATKKLERDQIEGTEAIKYLTNEIKILHKLNHPNIAKFESVKKTKKHFYIVMEYCNGGELSKALEKYQEKYGKPFSQEIVQHFMRQIIDAFKYIHSNKIIHRDIKLENILINYESEQDKEDLNLMKATAKIIDFGFACFINKSGLLYSTLGSPINMDPIILKKLNSNSKKARQLGYDQKADVWSLGTICYEMLIGKSAFDSEDMDELVEKIENGTYTVPTNLSKEVISFINGMLQYESTKRLSCEELSRHPFLTKEVKDFHPIDIQKVSKKVEDKKLKINVKQNKSIWAIFNADDEEKLIKIDGNQFGDNKNQAKRLVSQANVAPKLENQNIPIRRENSAQMDSKDSDNNYGPMLPSQGIPGNPTNQNIQPMQKEGDNEFHYSFSGGIFES
jgi:serine/threonine protein kinase